MCVIFLVNTEHRWLLVKRALLDKAFVCSEGKRVTDAVSLILNGIDCK